MFIPVVLLMAFVSQFAFRIGYFSRAAIGSAREYIADAEAVRLTQNPAALASALRKIDGCNRIADLAESHDAMLIAGAVSGPHATHPAIDQRIAALIQLTGPAMSYAPLRRDTRTAEQPGTIMARLAQGEDFLAEAAGAGPPSLRHIFRQSRDPDLNALGLSRKAERAVLTCIAGATALWGGSWYMTGQVVGLQETTAMIDGARLGARCQLASLEALLGTDAFPADCSPEADERASAAARAALAADIARRERQKEQEAAQRTATYHLNRCFPFTLKPWDQRLSRNDPSANDLDHYRRWAEQPIAGIEIPAMEGETNADGLIDYMDMRLLMANSAAYWFGQEGLDTLYGALATRRHRRALEAFRIALDRPSFAACFERASAYPRDVRLLAAMPDASPCDFVKKQGRFITRSGA